MTKWPKPNHQPHREAARERLRRPISSTGREGDERQRPQPERREAKADKAPATSEKSRGTSAAVGSAARAASARASEWAASDVGGASGGAAQQRAVGQRFVAASRGMPSVVRHDPAPFHLAFPVHDLEAARAFYGGLLGCPEGRSAANGSISISTATRSSPISRPTQSGGGQPIRSTATTCRCRISARCCRWTSGSRWPSGWRRRVPSS